eukprot:374397-Rhodomonas_salina.1
MVRRRFEFCRSKLGGMRGELEEAKAIGLADLAADLASAVAKFEAMQVDADQGLQGADKELARVHAVLDAHLAQIPPEDAEAAGLKEELLKELAALKHTRTQLNFSPPEPDPP